MELELRKFLQQTRRGCWYTFLEPAAGSSTGVPDMLVMIPNNSHPLPVELKRGLIVKHHLFTPKIRPAQIRWHDELARAGGRSCILFGVPTDPKTYRLLALTRPSLDTLRTWRAGIPMGELVDVSSPMPGGGLHVDELARMMDDWQTPHEVRR